MKRNIIFAAAIVLMTSGCAVDEIDKTSSLSEGVSPEFQADLSSAMEESKVYVDSDLNLRWTADDRISIFTNTCNQEYRYTGDTGSRSGSFDPVSENSSVTGNSIDRNYAVYPYNENNTLSESGKMTVILPEIQSYAENTFGQGANTMVAVTSGNSDYFLPFRNLCGYLVVKLYGDATVKTLTLKGNNSEKIAGTATLTPNYGESPAATVSDDGSETITVDCGDGVTIGTTEETATSFWFVVPPVTFSNGFTITMTDCDGATMEKSTSTSRTIQRNVVNSMAALETIYEKYVPEYVDLGLSVRWATCNLGATSPEGYGRYYAYGDVTGQTWNGSWSGGGFSTNHDFELDDNGNLKAESDAAYVKFGGEWRMPTKDEYQELLDNCTSTWTSDYNGTGIAGRIFTSNKEGFTDKSIFLPAAGYGNSDNRGNGNVEGNYWSSTYSSTPSDWFFFMYSDRLYMTCGSRKSGYSIRPVYAGEISVTSIALSETSIGLLKSSTKQLTVTYEPVNASSFELEWTSSDEKVATVSADGLVTAVGLGTCRITASVGDIKAECSVSVIEYVDLGLSVKWATCNLGAYSPEAYGTYFGWGDVTGQTWDGSQWSSEGFTSYPSYELDEDKNLKPEYDAAHVILGGNWRMPTYDECQELIDNCTSKLTNDYNGTGVAGRILTSKKEGYTDKSIFLPYSGYGSSISLLQTGSSCLYWSSSFNTGNYAYTLYISSDGGFTGPQMRKHGMPVRPVSE